MMTRGHTILVFSMPFWSS